MMNFSRITILTGHYGSGKTGLAVNLAFYLKEKFDNVIIADLDIVNPYFRTVDSAQLLEEKGIRLISSVYANTNLEAFSVPPEIRSVFSQKDAKVVFDIGGDDAGAIALGQFYSLFQKDDYEMLFVINRYRYLTQSTAETIEVMHEIEAASHLKFHGIINNSNLGEETTAKTILDSQEYANEVARLSGLGIKFTSVREDLIPALEGKLEPVLGVKIYKKTIWDI
ncbi:MAG: hypothetical protein N2Z65_06970 [Clostridiales bacterium]|nr:hypothetical protein [Clostridiales bacterium]